LPLFGAQAVEERVVMSASADLVQQVTQDRAQVQAARRAIAARAAQRLAI
jgi:hypothetical protein